MNAYELADQVEMWGEDLLALNMKGGIPVVQGAKMLRQQADRIAELEKFNKAILKKGGYPYEKSNPVAWMSPDGKVSTTEDILFHIPLYTTPQTKPLSDEEIYALWCEADNTELLPEMRLKDGSINYIITTFAKLIEERHGIK